MVDCRVGMGKEIRLTVSAEEARSFWDSGVFGGSVRMHELQACEIPLLWRPPYARIALKGERRCVFQDMSRRGRARGSPQEQRAVSSAYLQAQTRSLMRRSPPSTLEAARLNAECV
jgi:hypothetical protein